MPPSSLYWIQKSASSSSSAAGNRSSAASPDGRPPRLALAVRLPPSSPTPTVPAPTASELRRNERRLRELFRGLTFFSKLSSKGRFSLLLESFAVGLVIAFMPAESQQFKPRAAWEKLRVCYRWRLVRVRLSSTFAIRCVALNSAQKSPQGVNPADFVMCLLTSATGPESSFYIP